MANKTINELSPVTLSSTSEFAVYQNGSTGKATLQNILGSEDFLYAYDDDEPTGEVEFESADTTLTPSSSVSVDLLTGNDSWGQRFAKVSQMFKNVRYLLGKLGTTDISTIGNGTVTGAISTLNGKVDVQSSSYTYAGVNFYFRKVGRICIVTSNSACNVVIPTNAYAANAVSFHEKYRPAGQVISRQMQDANGNSVSINIDTNDTIKMGYAGTQMPSGTLIRVVMCYITAL